MVLILNVLKIFLFFSTVTFFNYRLLSKGLKLRQKKSNTDTDTSCSQLGKGKRKKSHKSQNICNNSDSDSLKMTPPPSITIHHDIWTGKMFFNH